MVNPFDIYPPVTLESGQLHEQIDKLDKKAKNQRLFYC